MSAFTDAAIERVTFFADDPSPRVYKERAVPANPTYPYSTISVTGDRAEAYTLDIAHGVRMRRIVYKSYGHTLDGAEDFDTLGVDALLDHSLEVDGYDCGPCLLELASGLQDDPDDTGVVGITTTLTFASTKEVTP